MKKASPAFAKRSELKISEDGVILFLRFSEQMVSDSASLQGLEEAGKSNHWRRSVVYLISSLLEFHFGDGAVSGMEDRRDGLCDLDIIQCDNHAEDVAKTSINGTTSSLNPKATPFVSNFGSNAFASMATSGASQTSSPFAPFGGTPFSKPNAFGVSTPSAFTSISGSSSQSNAFGVPTAGPSQPAPNAFASTGSTFPTSTSAPSVLSSAPPSGSGLANAFGAGSTSFGFGKGSAFGGTFMSTTSSTPPAQKLQTPILQEQPSQAPRLQVPAAMSEMLMPTDVPPMSSSPFSLAPPVATKPPSSSLPFSLSPSSTPPPKPAITPQPPHFPTFTPFTSPFGEQVKSANPMPTASPFQFGGAKGAATASFTSTSAPPTQFPINSISKFSDTDKAILAKETALVSTKPTSSMPPPVKIPRKPSLVVPLIKQTSIQPPPVVQSPKPDPKKGWATELSQLEFQHLFQSAFAAMLAETLAKESYERSVRRQLRRSFNRWVNLVTDRCERKMEKVEKERKRAEEWASIQKETLANGGVNGISKLKRHRMSSMLVSTKGDLKSSGGRQVKRRLDNGQMKSATEIGEEVKKVCHSATPGRRQNVDKRHFVSSGGEYRQKHWESGTFLESVKEEVTLRAAASGSSSLPPNWSIILSTNPLNPTSAGWLRVKFGLEYEASNMGEISSSITLSDGGNDQGYPGLIVFECSFVEPSILPAERFVRCYDCRTFAHFMSRSRILADDASRLFQVLRALPRDRHYSTRMMIIVWANDTESLRKPSIPMPILSTVSLFFLSLFSN